MALIIFALTLIAFFNWAKVMVEIKLIIVCVDLNLSSLIIFCPTVGVTDKKIQLHLFTISWLFFAIITFLNSFLSFWDVDLFREETIILSNNIFDLQMPVITDAAILPVPINPKFILFKYTNNHEILGKKKAPL